MLVVDGVTVEFAGVTALDDVSLDIGDGELVALLGPSGCGKSTLLRAIGGLQPVDGGRIFMDDVDLAGVAPHRRGIGLMFQDHALFPHRDVGANVEFGLRMAGLGRAQRRERVKELLDVVDLAGFEQREITTLSGGEAQRVALARALAPRPRLLLLDEPLGALDRRLRDRLVDDLALILRDLGIAALHVTHDHDEAFAVGERLFVMGQATVLRTGPPVEVWSHPGTEEVARFLGHHNIIERGFAGNRGRALVFADGARVDPDGELDVSVVRVRIRRGRRETIVRRRDGTELVFELDPPPTPGAQLRLWIDPARVVALSE